MQDFINSVNKAASQERSKHQMTLGQLIKELKPLVGKGYNITARELRSYRGYYTDLCLTPDVGKLDKFYVLLEGAVGQTFEGYKGGDFVMGADTPLWFAGYGDCGEAIMSVKSAAYTVYFETKDVDGVNQ